MIVIAVEDTYIQEEYFGLFRSSRIQLRVIPTPGGRGSSPHHVLARLKAERESHEWEPGDEFWLSVDTDRWKPGELKEVCTEARQQEIRVVVCSPCFETWLLLHLGPLTIRIAECKVAEQELKRKLGGYTKRTCPPGLVTASTVAAAIARAKAHQPPVPEPGKGWPTETGTQVHFLVERLLELGAEPPLG